MSETEIKKRICCLTSMNRNEDSNQEKLEYKFD